MSLKNHILAHKDMLYRIAFSMLGNQQDAEDVISELFVKVWHQQERFRKYDHLERVLIQTVRNQCIDMLRARKRFQRLDESVPNSHAHAEVEPSDSKFVIVQQIIRRLPEKQQLMIHLRMVEGYSMEQIAEVMELKVNTVEVSLSRARKKIRAEYEKVRIR